MKPPVIVCPLSRNRDEIAGDTPDEVAINLHQATLISLRFRCKPLRKLPDVRSIFRPYNLSPEARTAVEKVAAIYRNF